MRYKKEDVTFHSDNWRERHAAANVKVYGYPTADLVRRVLADNGLSSRQDPDMILDALQAAEESGDYSAWEMGCESGWDMLANDAEELFGRGHSVTSEGRSGGWAVVTYNGRPTFDAEDVEGWDAIELSRWARFVRYARDAAEDVPYQIVSAYVLNRLVPETDVEGLALAGVGL